MTGTPIWGHDVRRHEAGTTVVLTGELDMAASDQLRDVLIEELTRSGTSRVTADLSGVTFLDSTGLSSLLSAHTTAADLGRTFTVANASRPARRILEVTGLFDLLTTP